MCINNTECNNIGSCLKYGQYAARREEERGRDFSVSDVELENKFRQYSQKTKKNTAQLKQTSKVVQDFVYKLT